MLISELLNQSKREVLFEVDATEVGVLFPLGEVLDAFLHVVADGADGDLAVVGFHNYGFSFF